MHIRKETENVCKILLILGRDVIKVLVKKVLKVHTGHHKLKPVKLSECAIVDDLICVEHANHLQENAQIWEEKLLQIELKINDSKTKVMAVRKEIKSKNRNKETIGNNWEYLSS